MYALRFHKVSPTQNGRRLLTEASRLSGLIMQQIPKSPAGHYEGASAYSCEADTSTSESGQDEPKRLEGPNPGVLRIRGLKKHFYRRSNTVGWRVVRSLSAHRVDLPGTIGKGKDG
jgi:hypothetical protein